MDTTENNAIEKMLLGHGIRPTRQRILLGSLLFDGVSRHINAEQLHAEVCATGQPLALATVYNTLNQFVAAGLMRQVVVEAGKIYFDTNTHDHHHFFDADTNMLTDIPASAIQLSNLPAAPDGRSIAQVDVIIRLK